jgi:hypothetical protein
MISYKKPIFSKILIAIILTILIGGGILAWQYFGIPEEAESKFSKIEKP